MAAGTSRLSSPSATSLMPPSLQGPVELVWETSEPYQSVVQVTSSEPVTIRGLAIRHYSKSVANNYAVFVQVGAARGAYVLYCTVPPTGTACARAHGSSWLLRLVHKIYVLYVGVRQHLCTSAP